MKSSLFRRDASGRSLVSALLFVLLHGCVSAFFGPLLPYYSMVPAAVAQAWLFLHAGPIFCLVSLPLAFLPSLLGGGVLAGAFALSYFVCGLLLALAIRHRISRAYTVVWLTVAIFAFFAIRTYGDLAAGAAAAGYGDAFTYLRDLLDGFLDRTVETFRYFLDYAAKVNAAQGVELNTLTDAEIRTALSQMLSLLPAYLTLLLCLPALAMTFGMQLLSYMQGNRHALSAETWPYQIGPVGAGAYFLLLPVVLFASDYASPLFVSCINVYTVLSYALALGGLLLLPGLVGRIRYFSVNRSTFVMWILVLVLIFLLNTDLVLRLLAIFYAYHILKKAFKRARPREER